MVQVLRPVRTTRGAEGARDATAIGSEARDSSPERRTPRLFAACRRKRSNRFCRAPVSPHAHRLTCQMLPVIPSTPHRFPAIDT